MPLFVILTSAMLGLGIFGPCMKIAPGFGEYSPLVRLLKPDLTEPTQFSLFSGITRMAQEGNLWLAALIFAFTILFPIAKLSVYWIAVLESPEHPSFAKTVKCANHLGKFSMVDVFVIALLVVAIKGLPGDTEVTLRWGFWCFCVAIVASLLMPLALKKRGSPSHPMKDSPQSSE